MCSGITTATVTRNHGFMVFDTLYGMNAAGEPVPEMVGAQEVSEDGKVWTLRLRELQPQSADLETAFLEITGGSGEGTAQTRAESPDAGWRTSGRTAS